MAQGLPPDLDFTGVFSKLARAEEHFKAVDSEISKWLEKGRYETFFERGAQTGRIGIGLCQIGPPPDLVRWALIIGDCINNLRAALDHLAFLFTNLPAAYTPPAKERRVSFVIIDDPAEFGRAMKGNLSGFAPKFSALFESLQPFMRIHPLLPPLLSIIRDLSNADKHRLLQVAGAGVVQLSATILGDTGRGTKIIGTNPEPIKNNDIICFIESAQPDPHLAVQSFAANVEIAIWHGARQNSTNPLDARTGYSRLLPMLIAEVRFVIDQFKFAV